MSFRLSAIDNDELIHHSIRQGHIISLEIYLNQNPHCLNKLYTYNQFKWTPLLAACYYKHEHIVRWLLSRYKPDIEAKGTIIFDMIGNQTEIVEDVSALWTAVAVDHFDIVRLLIEQGQANINHLTKTHSTPFRVACYNNNLELAKYLFQHGANPYQRKLGNYTNLMLSSGRRYPLIVKYLIDNLHSNINEEDENGQTALYYAIKSGSSDIVKYLLENGAKNTHDKLRNVTPLMRAALYGEIDLVETFYGYCTDIEWIEAKELLGATFGGCVARLENLNKTIEYITEAFQLRLKKNLPKIIKNRPVEIFNFRSECLTIEEFNQLIQSNSKDDLRIETIRIHQRLLGSTSNDYHHVLRYYGAILADNYRYDDCLRWWFYEIDLKQKYQINFKKEYLRCFIDIFIEMKLKNISFENLIRLLKILHNELQLNIQNNDYFDYNFYTLLYLITIIARILFSLDEDIKQDLTISNRKELFHLIKFIIQHQYRTNHNQLSLLHLSSSSLTTPYSDDISYPCWMTIHLLIHCGENVDVLDLNHNTPLHILVQNNSISNIQIIIDILWKFGAHFDHVNNKGEIPLDLIPIYHNNIIQYMKDKMGVKQLKCICARLIRKECLNCQEFLSRSLINFIQKH